LKTKSFQTYLAQRLDKNEIAQIKEQAQLEIHILKSINALIFRDFKRYIATKKRLMP